MMRPIVLALVVAFSSTFLLGCPTNDKAAPDNKAAAAPSVAPAAASAKPAAKGGW
jgi:hypothetical protein